MEKRFKISTVLTVIAVITDGITMIAHAFLGNLFSSLIIAALMLVVVMDYFRLVESQDKRDGLRTLGVLVEIMEREKKGEQNDESQS